MGNLISNLINKLLIVVVGFFWVSCSIFGVVTYSGGMHGARVWDGYMTTGFDNWGIRDSKLERFRQHFKDGEHIFVGLGRGSRVRARIRVRTSMSVGAKTR